MKGFVHIAAPVATLVGVLVSVIGTYLITQSEHPFSHIEFWKSVAKVLWLLITGRKAAAEELVQTASGVAMNTKSLAISLFGLYIVFIGFLIQGLGSILWCVDAIADLCFGK